MESNAPNLIDFQPGEQWMYIRNGNKNHKSILMICKRTLNWKSVFLIVLCKQAHKFTANGHIFHVNWFVNAEKYLDNFQFSIEWVWKWAKSLDKYDVYQSHTASQRLELVSIHSNPFTTVWLSITMFVNVLSEWAFTIVESKPISVVSNVRFSTHLAFGYFYLGFVFTPNGFPLLNFISYLMRVCAVANSQKLHVVSRLLYCKWFNINITHLIKYVKCHHSNYTNTHARSSSDVNRKYTAIVYSI